MALYGHYWNGVWRGRDLNLPVNHLKYHIYLFHVVRVYNPPYIPRQRQRKNRLQDRDASFLSFHEESCKIAPETGETRQTNTGSIRTVASSTPHSPSEPRSAHAISLSTLSGISNISAIRTDSSVFNAFRLHLRLKTYCTGRGSIRKRHICLRPISSISVTVQSDEEMGHKAYMIYTAFGTNFYVCGSKLIRPASRLQPASLHMVSFPHPR